MNNPDHESFGAVGYLMLSILAVIVLVLIFI